MQRVRLKDGFGKTSNNSNNKTQPDTNRDGLGIADCAMRALQQIDGRDQIPPRYSAGAAAGIFAGPISGRSSMMPNSTAADASISPAAPNT